MLTCEMGECVQPDCPCIKLARYVEREWIERAAKAARNVGDLWALRRGMQEIAAREIERLNRKLILPQ